MGCFSYLCKESGKPINSDSCDGDACHIFLLKNGRVIEKMYGNYDSYGRVFGTKKNDDNDWTKFSSLNWKLSWGECCDLHHNDRNDCGFAAYHAKHYNGQIPTTISENDPQQGWGTMTNTDLVECPEHLVFPDPIEDTSLKEFEEWIDKAPMDYDADKTIVKYWINNFLKTTK